MIKKAQKVPVRLETRPIMINAFQKEQGPITERHFIFIYKIVIIIITVTWSQNNKPEADILLS